MAVKFPLKMADGAIVRTLEELREHFDLTAILAYYDNDRLTKWLENGYYDDEAQKVAALDATSADFVKELCCILGVNYMESDAEQVDLDNISKRNERIERLKQHTADDTILAAVDRVAFAQEELVGLLDAGATEIYLLGEQFIIPDGFEHISYIGINKNVTEFVKDAIESKADIQGGVDWLKYAAGQGDPVAQVRLGDCYIEGYGVERNYEKAVNYYRKAIEQGYVAALCSLGDCYTWGRGVELNLEEAVKWYKKAAEQGNAEAQYALGNYYYYGSLGNCLSFEGFERNIEEAVKWYRMAADQGDADAKEMVEQLSK